ncbi:MAG TPA: hypothetical protein PLW80_01670 [Spirochaetales bacterium]|nr:hypothetical protein [Spirochaetales bacterium]
MSLLNRRAGGATILVTRKRSTMPHTRNYRLLVLMALMQGIVFYGPVATI